MPFPRRMPQPREKDDSICSSSSPSPPPSARFTFDALAASARTRSSARELTPRERSHGVARVWTKGRAPRGGEGRDRTKGGKVESSSPRDQKRFPSPTVLCLHLFLALSPLLSSTTSELSDCKTMLSLSRAGVQPAPTTSKAGNPAPTEVGRAAALPRRSLLSTSLTSTSTTGLSSSARRRRRELSSVASAAQARDGTLFKLSFIL